MSKSFLLLLGFLTLTSAGATLWLWPRLAGRGVRPVAGRIGLLLGTQLSLAATFLFTVNALGGFYTSWGQLFGDSSTQFRLSDAGASGASLHDGGQLVVASDGHGQLRGVRSGVATKVTVFTPADYVAPNEPAKRFPVEVVDLTGGSGPQPVPNLQQLATRYRVIVAEVTAPASVPGVNVPEGPQGELFWSQDLRTALTTHYRVDAAPDDWGIAGVGQSGGAAINLAVQDSTRYGLAAAVGDWTSAPAQDDWPGVDRYLTSVPTPAVRVLYDPSAPDIPSRLRATGGGTEGGTGGGAEGGTGGGAEGQLQVATQTALSLTSALNWLGASIAANEGMAA